MAFQKPDDELASDERDDEITEPTDEDLLEEIRDRYVYFDSMWQDIREESRIDRKYLDGDPFEEADKKARLDNGRPAINHDELNQYVSQAANNARQARRAIKVNPGGDGASEKSAKFRQELIRGIEYRSKAQGVYTTALECALEGSYGFFRISRRYVNRKKNRDQEIIIKSIPNPDSVLFDPDCKEPDWSDARACFVLDPISKSEFKRRFPKAKVQDFSAEHQRIAKDWLQNNQVLTAEYWRLYGDDERGFKVMQYLTNGVEILDRLAQPGEHIPIIPTMGKQRFVYENGVPKRKLYSLVRLARDPQLSLAFLCSQETEEAGLTPKVPYKGWKGQFESDYESWEKLNQIPRSFIQADYPEWALERGIALQLPAREQFTPNFQEYEIAKDACRRAIQAAMGISPLPTAAQRNNEKSGVAIERISAQQELGSFHFSDNFERALEFAGRVIEEWIPTVYDTERDVTLRTIDDKHSVARINTPEPYQDPVTGEIVHYPVGDDGVHDLEVSSGPSYASEREEAATFLDTLIGNLQTLPVSPPQAAKLLALAIQMRQLGPKGDEMAEIISPQQQGQLPPAAVAQLQAAKAQLDQQGQLNQQLQAELQKLAMEKAAKIVDNEYRMSLEKLRIEAQAAAAEISTKSQRLDERLKFVEDLYAQLHSQDHESRMQAADQQHQQQIAQQQAEAQAQQAAAQPDNGAPPQAQQ